MAASGFELEGMTVFQRGMRTMGYIIAGGDRARYANTARISFVERRCEARR